MLDNTKTDVSDDEGNELLPSDPNSPEVDDMLSAIGTRGLDVVEGDTPSAFSALEQRLAQEGEEVELDLTPGAAESTSDPVRVYLREMGASPLLTREEEVEIAKRIERGQITSLKALSRSPIVIHQVLAIGDDLKRGLRSIKDTVVIDDEEITDEILQKRVADYYRKDRVAEQALQKCQPARGEAGDHFGEEEATRSSSLPRATGPRDGAGFAHHPQPWFELGGAQAPHRAGQ